MSPTQLRDAVARLTAASAADLDALWRQVSSAAQAREALRDVLPSIIERYGAAAGVLAAEWYDQQRQKAGVGGSFFAEPADLGAVGAYELAGYGVGPLFRDDPDWAAAQELVAGGLQRRIANASRNTVTRSSIADPGAAGWKRIGSGSCSFCRMLISRDQLYSEATADFASHDRCGCQAYPVLKGAEPIDVKGYIPSTRNISDADRARVRAYIASH